MVFTESSRASGAEAGGSSVFVFIVTRTDPNRCALVRKFDESNLGFEGRRVMEIHLATRERV